MTLFSALGYLPRWAKYTLVPDFARFLWWLVWVRVCAVAHVVHRAAVLQGALRQSIISSCSNKIKSSFVQQHMQLAAELDGRRAFSPEHAVHCMAGAWLEARSQHGMAAAGFATPLAFILLCHQPLRAALKPSHPSDVFFTIASASPRVIPSNS